MTNAALKLLLDQGLPRSAADHLRAAGLDAVHVGEIGMSRALDEEILVAGRESGRVVVTLDADFHALLAMSGESSPSVIRLRVERLGGLDIARLIHAVLEECGADLVAGAVATADLARVRLRRLPLGT